jgi:hypothetical protein
VLPDCGRVKPDKVGVNTTPESATRVWSAIRKSWRRGPKSCARTRLRQLLETYEDVAGFYSPDVYFTAAEEYIPDVAKR